MRRASTIGLGLLGIRLIARTPIYSLVAVKINFGFLLFLLLVESRNGRRATHPSTKPPRTVALGIGILCRLHSGDLFRLRPGYFSPHPGPRFLGISIEEFGVMLVCALVLDVLLIVFVLVPQMPAFKDQTPPDSNHPPNSDPS